MITKRNVDVGDLIDAGGAGSRPLFVLTQTDALRVYVNVPQTYAQLIKPGQAVTVTQAELRGQRFKGTVARTACCGWGRPPPQVVGLRWRGRPRRLGEIRADAPIIARRSRILVLRFAQTGASLEAFADGQAEPSRTLCHAKEEALIRTGAR